MEDKNESRIKQIQQLQKKLKKEKDILCTMQGEFILSLIPDEKEKERVFQQIYSDYKYYGNFKKIVDKIVDKYKHPDSIYVEISYLVNIQNYITCYNAKLKGELNYLKFNDVEQIVDIYQRLSEKIIQIGNYHTYFIKVEIDHYLNIVDPFDDKKRALFMEIIERVFELT